MQKGGMDTGRASNAKGVLGVLGASGVAETLSADPCHLANLIAVAECQARTFAYCIRLKFLPPAVKLLFGGLTPSTGHAIRICKILRSEWKRRARQLRDMMFFQVNSTDSPRRAKKKWLEFCVSTGRMTEFIWQHMLAHLRAITPWKKPSPSNPIHTACEVPIPDCVQRVLSLGPKLATQPQLAPPEMLTLVRQVAKRAPEAETDRCVAEGIQRAPADDED
ncbi:hypothetical protein HPB50_008323 [Hyalomma asiaticum]|uniref:Uncharacterized protein n=1 Tax=Hyalomma asiaticum TaxID=266040 RepID=A0ACB7SWB2_HYAAI|nr:hypothetical protein HPB50_008323 [Hyalomma asiaticum]